MNSRQNMQSRYQRLGIDRAFLESHVPNLRIIMPEWWSGPPSDVDKVADWTFDAVTFGLLSCAMDILGFEGVPAPFNDWREVGRRVAGATLHYFFGSWRDRFVFLTRTLDGAAARRQLSWIYELRGGLAMAAAVGDWATFDRLLEWPGPDLHVDEGLDDRTPQDNAYQHWLAAQLRNEPTDFCAAQRQIIARSSRRRPKMLLAAAEALLADDAATTSHALAAYLRHYRQHEFDEGHVVTSICLDGTVLWYLARRRGLAVQVPEEALLVVPPE